MSIQPIDYSGSILNWDDAAADYVSRIAIAPRTTILTYDRIHGTDFASEFGQNASQEQIEATRTTPVQPAPIIEAPPAIQPIDYSGSILNWDDATADYVSRIAIAPRSTILTYDKIHGTNFASEFGQNAPAVQIAATQTTPIQSMPIIATTNTIQATPIVQTSNAGNGNGGSKPVAISKIDFSGSTTGWGDADALYVSRNALAPVSTIQTYDNAHNTRFAAQWGFDAPPEQRAAASSGIGTIPAGGGGIDLESLLPLAVGAALVYYLFID